MDMVHDEFFAEQKERNAYRRLEVLKDQGLVKHERIYWRKPGVWWASAAGVRLSGIDLRPYALNKVLLEHTLEQVNLYRATIKSGEEFLRWRTEREVRHEASEKPIPDALVAFAPQSWTALELELNNKRSHRYTELLRSYAERQDLDGVRFYFKSVDGARRAARIAAGVTTKVPTPAGYFRFYEYRPEGFFSDQPLRPPDKKTIRYLTTVPPLG